MQFTFSCLFPNTNLQATTTIYAYTLFTLVLKQLTNALIVSHNIHSKAVETSTHYHVNSHALAKFRVLCYYACAE